MAPNFCNANDQCKRQIIFPVERTNKQTDPAVVILRVNGQRAHKAYLAGAATTRSGLVDTDCLTNNEICRFHLTRSSFKCSPSARKQQGCWLLPLLLRLLTLLLSPATVLPLSHIAWGRIWTIRQSNNTPLHPSFPGNEEFTYKMVDAKYLLDRTQLVLQLRVCVVYKLGLYRKNW